MDLIWLKGSSVNDALHKCKYLDSYFYLQYPSVDHNIKKVKEIGPDALFYKVKIHIWTDLCHSDIVSDPEFWRGVAMPLGTL